MRHGTSRWSIPAWLLCLDLLAGGLAARAADPPAPKFDIEAVRSGYYDGLDKARATALQRLAAEGKTLRHDADGNVIQDASYTRAMEHYRAEKERLAAEVRRDPRRDAELDALREHAKLRPQDVTDSGTPPGHPAYGGGFSDRDVILGSTKQVNTFADSARQRGYTVEYGQGYVKIKELDVVAWDPDRITVRNPSGDEPIVQPKKRSATEQVDRLHDKEVVLGYEKPGVAQQVKKVEGDFRKGVPQGTREQHEWVASQGKAADKTLKAVDPDGALALVPAEQRERFQEIKSRTKDADNVADPFDQSDARARKLQQHQDDTAKVLREGLKAERRQRADEIRSLTLERQDLQKQLRATTDGGEAAKLTGDIDARDRTLRQLRQQQLGDDLTLRVVAKKNTHLQDQVIRPKQPAAEVDVPHTPSKGAEWAGKGVSLVGQTMDLYDAYSQEAEAAAREKRTFSQAKMAVNLFANVTGITQAVSTVEAVTYETGAGMKEYTQREEERLEREGYDVKNNPGLQEAIRRRAILRATGRATWEVSKMIPMLGDIVSGMENTYNLTEATVGVAYDTWKSRQIQELNRIEQGDQVDRAVGIAEQTRDLLRRQVAAAAADVQLVEQAVKVLPELDSEVTALEDRIRSQVGLLEKLTSGVDTGREPAPEALSDETLRLLGPAIGVEIKMAQGFTRDCEAAISAYKKGEMDRSELAERRGALQRQLEPIDVEYARLAGMLDEAEKAALAVADGQDAVQLHQVLAADCRTAKLLADTTQSLATRIAGCVKHHADLTRAFEEEKKRLNQFCVNFSTRPTGDEKSQAKLRQIRGEVIGLSIKANQLAGYTNQVYDLRRQASLLRAMADSLPAAPPATATAPPAKVAKAEATLARLRELREPAAAMTQAVETARERFRQLRELLPLDAPTFRLVAKKTGNSRYEFTLVQDRLPVGVGILYVWDFGDGTQGVVGKSTASHVYPTPGKYTANVGVFVQKPNVSEMLGEASVSVGGDEVTAKPPGGDTPVAGKLSKDCFPLLPDDLPKDWWHFMKPMFLPGAAGGQGGRDGVPREQEKAIFWRQEFWMSAERGSVPVKDFEPEYYRDPKDRTRGYALNLVTVSISGPFSKAELKNGEAEAKELEYYSKSTGGRYLSAAKKATVIDKSNEGLHEIELSFFHNGCRVRISQLGLEKSPASDATLEVALHLADVITQRLDKQFGKTWSGAKPPWRE